jgi:hypothetical protein
MMVTMSLGARFRVFPLYHQVEVCDVAAADCPRWERDDERVLASAQSIVMATRPDLEGDVEFDVRVAPIGDEHPAGHLLFDGELCTTGQGALVGSSLSGQMRRIPLSTGWHRVRIYTDQPTNPARFTVLFDPQPATV